MTWLISALVATIAFIILRIWWEAGVSKELKRGFPGTYLENSARVGFGVLLLTVFYAVALTSLYHSGEGLSVWAYLIGLAGVLLAFQLPELIGKGLVHSCEENVKKEEMEKRDEARTIENY